MRRHTSEAVIGVSVIVIILIILTAGYVGFAAYACGQSWPDIPNRYNLIVGCMVETPEDGWIPAANYRVLP